VLAFLTSLRHPANAADYATVEHLLQLSLRSVCAQTHDDFVVIVVGNRRPSFALPRNAHFVEVDFPPPVAEVGPHASRSNFVLDKGTKIGVGLLTARRFEPDMVMLFDADDFVSRRMAEFAAAQQRPRVWVVRDGYVLSRSRSSYRRQPEFNRTCGTSFLVPYEVYGVPDDLTPVSTQEQVARGFGDRLTAIMGAHRDADAWFEQHGWPPAPLPFRGAVYHVDTGENHSRKGMSGAALPVGKRLALELGVPRRPWSPSQLLLSLGPVPLGQSISHAVRHTARRLRRLAASAWHRLVPMGG
jgi:hypothetical protein